LRNVFPMNFGEEERQLLPGNPNPSFVPSPPWFPLFPQSNKVVPIRKECFSDLGLYIAIVVCSWLAAQASLRCTGTQALGPFHFSVTARLELCRLTLGSSFFFQQSLSSEALRVYEDQGIRTPAKPSLGLARFSKNQDHAGGQRSD